MDLTIPLENITLNIRVAVLVKKENGYVLEKSKGRYYFPIGGRVKAGETSLEAAKRELLEELGVEVNNLALRGIVELFFGRKNERVQEICFVYYTKDVPDIKLAKEFEIFSLEQINLIDFRPQIIKEIMKSDTDKILHFTMKEAE